jgi:hypothetical protein
VEGEIQLLNAAQINMILQSVSKINSSFETMMPVFLNKFYKLLQVTSCRITLWSSIL